MTVTVRKYNPGFLSDDELVASFCVRTEEFVSTIEMLRECDGSSNPHRIVIGPRGSGKTSLLLRVAAEIRRDPSLSRRFFPLVFAEESYEVGSAGEFWLECLSRLADQAPPEDDGPDFRRTFEELRQIQDERTLGDRCLAVLQDFCDREGKRLVLIVENLNMMFGDIDDKDTGSQLRHTLQTEPRILLLASATRRFEEIDNPDRALYDLFRVLTLRPLDKDGCATLWRTVTGQHRSPETIQALRILTGGSPRLLTIVARFGASLSLHELMTELLDLVDDHTEYFKSHLDALPAKERRVYVALAGLWKQATAREVAKRARLDTSKCSALLGRLVERGAVEVAGGGPRRKEYYLTERLYNIYYLMRRSRGPDPMIEALVRFMEALYSPRELTDIGVRLVRDYSIDAGPEWLVGPALKQLLESSALNQHRDEVPAAFREELQKDPTRGSVLAKLAEAIGLGPALVARAADRDGAISKASGSMTARREIFDEAVALADRNRTEDALAKCEEAIRRLGNASSTDILELAAKTLVLKGDILAGWDRAEDPWDRVGQALQTLCRDEAPVLSKIVSIGLSGGAVEPSRAPEALAAYDQVISRFGKNDAVALSDSVATAMLRKALICLSLERIEEALAALDEAICRSSNADADSASEVAARALLMRGFIFVALNNPEGALASLEEATRRFQENDASDAAEAVAYAQLFHGLVLSLLGRTEEALLPWDEAAGLFAKSETPLFVEMAAVTLAQKATALAGLDRVDEALGTFDEALRIYGEMGTPVLPEIAASTLVNRGYMLGRLKRIGEAMSVLDEAIGQFANEDAPAFLELSSNALFKKGELLEYSSRQEEALIVFQDIVNRFGDAGAPGILEVVAKSLLFKGNILHKMAQPDEAISALDEVVSRFGESASPALAEWVAKALVKKGDVFRNLDQPEEALAVNGEVVRRFGEQDVPALLGPVMAAHVGAGFALLRLSRPGEALCAFGDATRRGGGNIPPDVLPMFALAHAGLGDALRTLDRLKEALVAFDQAARLFEEGEGLLLRERSGAALIDKAGLELGLQRYAAAIETTTRALDPSFTLSADNRIQGQLIRAKATLADGNPSACERDIQTVLALLPELAWLPGHILDVLMAFSIQLGPAQMLALIQSSPSAATLLPLATALERELGMEPRVAREVEEVAEDIRERLARIREAAGYPVHRGDATDPGQGGKER